MGDINHEPTMEEILASIKRIIAEDGDAALATRRKRSERPRGAAEREQVLELTNPFQPDAEAIEREDTLQSDDAAAKSEATEPFADAAQGALAPRETEGTEPVSDQALGPKPAPMVSHRAEAVSRAALAALSAVSAPEARREPAGDPPVDGGRTVEELVREMLRPMLAQWLDAHLPAMVETLVAREIERITRERS